ncbi:MAG: hypothetical protein N2C14_05720, partial [Planctomycetales bacterium]
MKFPVFRFFPSLGCNRWWLVGFAAWCAWGPLDSNSRVWANKNNDALHAKAAALDKQFTTESKALASWCEQQGLKEEAKQTLDWVRTRDPYLIYSPKLPREMRPMDLPAGASAEATKWSEQWQGLREQHAERLYDLAREAIRARQAGPAYEWVLETARQNPDHEPARRALGYQKFQDHWRTPYEVGQIRRGRVWLDGGGWVPKIHVARYESGKRLYQRKWISVESEAEQRHAKMDPWTIETEHYEVRTTHSLAEGVRLGERLEEQQRIWRHVFVPYHTSPNNFSGLFEGRGAGKPFRHKVIYYRTREEYIKGLKDYGGS